MLAKEGGKDYFQKLNKRSLHPQTAHISHLGQFVTQDGLLPTPMIRGAPTHRRLLAPSSLASPGKSTTRAMNSLHFESGAQNAEQVAADGLGADTEAALSSSPCSNSMDSVFKDRKLLATISADKALTSTSSASTQVSSAYSSRNAEQAPEDGLRADIMAPPSSSPGSNSTRSGSKDRKLSAPISADKAPKGTSSAASHVSRAYGSKNAEQAAEDGLRADIMAALNSSDRVAAAQNAGVRR